MECHFGFNVAVAQVVWPLCGFHFRLGRELWASTLHSSAFLVPDGWRRSRAKRLCLNTHTHRNDTTVNLLPPKEMVQFTSQHTISKTTSPKQQPQHLLCWTTKTNQQIFPTCGHPPVCCSNGVLFGWSVGVGTVGKSSQRLQVNHPHPILGSSCIADPSWAGQIEEAKVFLRQEDSHKKGEKTSCSAKK